MIHIVSESAVKIGDTWELLIQKKAENGILGNATFACVPVPPVATDTRAGQEAGTLVRTQAGRPGGS